MAHIIYLFMWSYQSSYRIHLQSLARDVLKLLGTDGSAEAFLIGVRSPDSNNRNKVCIDPEDGKWPLILFDGILDSIELIFKDHEMQHIFFGDEPSMRDKPEWMRRDSVRSSVSTALKIYDTENNVTSFCGSPRKLGEYYVTPVIQIPNTIFSLFPYIPTKENYGHNRSRGYRSLIHAAIYTVLDEATDDLEKPEPGRHLVGRMRNSDEIVRIAAKKFLHTPGLTIEKQYTYPDLFDSLNLISSLMYEGAKGIGDLILVDPECESVEFLVKFSDPVSFRQPRWVRKILQMAKTGIGIIANSQYIYGLGKLKSSHCYKNQDAFIVSFIDHYHWELKCGNQTLLSSHYAIPKLPQEPFEKTSFLANYARLFPQSKSEDGLHLWELMLTQLNQRHGSMIIVAEDANSEAKRLSRQGTTIIPTKLTESLLQSVSGIDGTILLDPKGYCHAIGIILDGEANENCTPSRGSRFNSGVRYVQATKPRRLAIIVSDDRTIDIIPQIMKLVSRRLIERYISTFESSTIENFHDSRNWLNEHRFYMNAQQCSRINTVISKLDIASKDVDFLYFGIALFEVHPEMDESYLTD
ncbi:hypothetical protein ACE18P_16535 [Escherichia fergusonii]|uniref:hypothetical protein n=1 Tax=Escherichia fergusonii TaxID=564 RepID=UPI0035C13D35